MEPVLGRTGEFLDVFTDVLLAFALVPKGNAGVSQLGRVAEDFVSLRCKRAPADRGEGSCASPDAGIEIAGGAEGGGVAGAYCRCRENGPTCGELRGDAREELCTE